MSEIQAFVELKLPKVKTKREKMENDRVIMRQLIANIDRNRMKIRKELLDSGSVGGDMLSHSRRIVITSIKDRIDEQAHLLEIEESRLKEQCDYYRRKEDRLRVMRQKLDILDREAFTDSEIIEEDRRDGLVKELQADYEKYLQTYGQGKGSKRGLEKDRAFLGKLETA
jgi:hypothetical protein